MLNRLWAYIAEPGPLKTPVVAVAGWLTWSNVRPIFEAVVLIGTAAIVCIHFTTWVTRLWCPKRRASGDCAHCRLQHSIFCPAGLSSSDTSL